MANAIFLRKAVQDARSAEECSVLGNCWLEKRNVAACKNANCRRATFFNRSGDSSAPLDGAVIIRNDFSSVIIKSVIMALLSGA